MRNNGSIVGRPCQQRWFKEATKQRKLKFTLHVFCQRSLFNCFHILAFFSLRWLDANYYFANHFLVRIHFLFQNDCINSLFLIIKLTVPDFCFNIESKIRKVFATSHTFIITSIECSAICLPHHRLFDIS